MRETAVIAVDVAPDELPDAIGVAIGEVEAAMREAGVGLAGPPFARYLAFEPRIRAEIGFPVLRPAPHVGRVFPGRLPGGRVASIVHIGSYDGLEQTYGLMHRWLARAGPRAHRADLGGLLERPGRRARSRRPGARRSSRRSSSDRVRGRRQPARRPRCRSAPAQPRATRTPSVRRCA